MKLFKKIAQFISDKLATAEPKPQPQSQPNPVNDAADDTAHQADTLNSTDSHTATHPITDELMVFLDAHNWKYEHRHANTADGYTVVPQIHHLIVPFSDKDAEWTCVFRINERTQLVSIFGILPEVVPQSHFAPMTMAIAMANLGIPFGNLELDPTDGEVRAKISFDAEFTPMTDKALGCHLQGLASLTELAQKAYDDVLSDPEPSLILLDYLHFHPEHFIDSAEHSTDANAVRTVEFFEPTDQYQ